MVFTERAFGVTNIADKLQFFGSLALITNRLPIDMKKIAAYIPFCLMLFFSKTAAGQTHIFAQLMGSPVNTSGWNL